MAKIMKFTKEEIVFAKQLFEIRKSIAQLQVEEKTHADRLLTILRGHRAEEGHSEEFTVIRSADKNIELVIVVKRF